MEARSKSETNDIDALKELEATFHAIYHKYNLYISKMPQYQEATYWLNMITVMRFRAKKGASPSVSPMPVDVSTTSAKANLQSKDNLKPETRKRIVEQLEEALAEYKSTLIKVKHKSQKEKNPRYEAIYNKTLMLTKNLELTIILFKDGASLDQCIGSYKAAFNNNDLRDELQKNRSHPWFRRYVSLPIERLKEAVNQVALTYYQWKCGNIPLAPDLIERPFFSKPKTSSHVDAEKLEQSLEKITQPKQ